MEETHIHGEQNLNTSYTYTHVLTRVIAQETHINSLCSSTHIHTLVIHRHLHFPLLPSLPFLSFLFEFLSWFIQYTLAYATLCALPSKTVVDANSSYNWPY
ncbi:hypothetical protein ACTXT7_012171 [Hymenolepis weldensis]